MPEELHIKYRPNKLEELVGQEAAVKILKGLFDAKRIPHATILVGPSGCGKTTAARIIADQLGCKNYKEVNASDDNGVAVVRGIISKCRTYGIAGGPKVYTIDEAHGLTTAAQNAILKVLEEPPDHVYFIIATTDPAKILPTVKTRCTEIVFRSVPPASLGKLIKRVAGKEGIKLTDEVSDALIESASGSPRQALVNLGKIATIKDEADRLASLSPPAVTATAMTIVNGLLPWQGEGNWSATAKAIMDCQEDLERVRQTVLTIASKKLVTAKSKAAARANLIIIAFADPFFNSRKAGMLSAAYQVFHTA